MAISDLYKVLGVGREVDAKAIKRAYRRLALALHPDTGAEPSAERFREVREAYEVLSDPARRRLYDRRMARERIGPARSRADAPPIRSHDPLGEWFSRAASLDRLFDQLRSEFFGSAPARRLRMEIVLSPLEARTGGRLPIDHPILGERFWLDVAPGVRSGERRQVEVVGPGASLTLDIRFEVN